MCETRIGEQFYAHFGKLLNFIDTEGSEQQRAELVSTLRKYSDVFSTGELDLGETSLAAHRIETGDDMPMRQRLKK